ncbi:hypothetical protein pEaSNUABM29_00046 [Erwinia phage pEa_SNUABM_29]|nr:hypothetical protein pEaSNUABM29_00046 [Erwinia phage pEa_SNUABM_29]
MLRVVERTEKILDREWLEDRKALSFLNNVDPLVLRDERRLYYRVFEVFSRDTVAPDATVLCLDHGFMLEIIDMARSLDAQLRSMADALLKAAGRNYVTCYTRNEGEEYARMGFCCETVNYRKLNPRPTVDPDLEFCDDVSSMFPSRKEFLDWVRFIYGQNSIYAIVSTGGRLMSCRGEDGTVMVTAVANNQDRWLLGSWMNTEGVVRNMTRIQYARLMRCIQSALPEGDELIFTYHQYDGGCEAMWLLEHGWLPDSYLYGRTLKLPNGENNVN